MKRTIVLFTFFFLLLAAACRKESFITGKEADLGTSEDSLYYDTLFTSTGSVTQFFKIFNKNDRRLRISRISLGGGENSFFAINADGREGPDVSDLEMEANDSLYVFVTVKIDPTTANLPFIIRDSINISYNGNEKRIQLSAWGQNANFLRGQVITSDTTWKNNKPIVITGGVLVPDGVTLTIQKGTRIYLHADAPLLVDGTIIATGEKFDSTRIVFQGDRLDEYYRDIPGSWPGIYFRESSKNNLLKQVIIKNAYQGIVCEKPASGNGFKLKLDECIIDNCYDAGILGVNTSISGVNCLISNCGKNLLMVQGGKYDFNQCTDVAYSNLYISHKQPVLAITDFIKVADVVTTADLDAKFTNCIFWGGNGTVDDEAVVVREGNDNFNVAFTNCLWKVQTAPAQASTTGMIANADPVFEEIETTKNKYNFRLKEGSPGINSGINTGVQTDLDGNGRLNIPDIGSYETTF
jgi:hypothetical protein